MSIIFEHPLNTISTDTDGKLFVKSSNEWSEIKNSLYKSESKTPLDSEGVDGDYFAKYLKKFNHLLYSEDFTQNVWNQNNILINKEISLSFPSSCVSKIIPEMKESKHSLSYVFSNQLNKPYTFSLYVKESEYNKLQISITDKLKTHGQYLNIDLNENKAVISSFGNTDSSIVDYKLEPILITDIKGFKLSYFRIYLSVLFKTTYILSANITMLDNNGNDTFMPKNNTDGIFINAAQLACNSVPESYISTNGAFKTSVYLDKLYRKENGSWKTIDNKLYSVSKPLLNDFGNPGDIATYNAIVKFDNLMIVGNGSSVGKFHRPAGTLRYSKRDKLWYVQTDVNEEYALQFAKPKVSYKEVLMAISLNQQTYQTYSRYCSPNAAHYRGIFNTGGCYNGIRKS